MSETGITTTTTTTAAAAPPLHVPQPSFDVVMAVCGNDDDWSVQGVFTLRADAERLVAALDADPLMHGACIGTMTMAQLKDELIKDRLGVFAKAIETLARAISKR